MNQVTCPSCRGEKRHMAFVDGHDENGQPFGGLREVDCHVCEGMGTISEERAEGLQRGSRFRLLRLKRDMTPKELADELGIDWPEIFHYQNARPMTDDAKVKIEAWMASQGASFTERG